jgi:hypothetical protein
MSAAGFNPVEVLKMLGNRSTARLFIAVPDMSCVFDFSVSRVNAPCGRFGTPPGVVTA